MSEQQVPAIALKVAPQPLNNSWDIGADPDQGVVIITVHGPGGIAFYMMDGKSAEALGAQFIQAGKSASTGLVLAPGLLR